MFALHYFFVTEHSLRTFLQNVADNLKPGTWRVARGMWRRVGAWHGDGTAPDVGCPNPACLRH